MKPLPHRYTVRLAGGPGGHATVTADGLPDLRTAPPLDFDGPGDAWSPEHLLLAAVETCFLFT
jgi:organic hydroperoxide reductase OsmC/OhrA